MTILEQKNQIVDRPEDDSNKKTDDGSSKKTEDASNIKTEPDSEKKPDEGPSKKMEDSNRHDEDDNSSENEALSLLEPMSEVNVETDLEKEIDEAEIENEQIFEDDSEKADVEKTDETDVANDASESDSANIETDSVPKQNRKRHLIKIIKSKKLKISKSLVEKWKAAKDADEADIDIDEVPLLLRTASTETLNEIANICEDDESQTKEIKIATDENSVGEVVKEELFEQQKGIEVEK